MWQKEKAEAPLHREKKSKKYEDSQVCEEWRGRRILYRKAINSHWPFFRSDTQWFACILINDTYLSCLRSCLLFYWTDYNGPELLFLLCISTWVYCHSNHKYSTILFKGRFVVIISILCSLFSIFERACVHFALLSCHWYSTILSGFIFPYIWYFFIGNIIYMKMRHFLLVFFIFSLRMNEV